jgi:hypothetical protein
MDWPTLIAASYLAEVGEPLCDPAELEDLPAVVLCHDTADDPVLVFANRAARDRWEAPLVGMPSRLTAPADQRAERAEALSGSGVVRGYSGIRVSATGRLFRIEDATVWQVRDAEGRRVGQAATFARSIPVTG